MAGSLILTTSRTDMAHWYKPSGEPFYEVPNLSRGGTRPASITDARKVQAYPSVTAIIGIPDKPALTNWKIEQSIMAALTNPDIRPDMDVKTIMSILKRDAAREAKEAAERGSAVHDAIEAHYKGRIVPHEHRETVQAVVDLIDHCCGYQEWEAEKWFASPLGYGGKIDLISPEWVIDFKTKPGPAVDHKMYDDQLMQLVAYDCGTTKFEMTPWFFIDTPMLKKRARHKANVIVSRDIPGSVQWHSWDGADEEKQWDLFHLLLQYWQAKNDYWPHLEAA